MYSKIKREIEDIKKGVSPYTPQDLANWIADLLSDCELTTSEYLKLMDDIKGLV